jgi:uncharacterized membrane protein YgcG
MEAMLGFFLYSYPYLNQQKRFCLSYYCLFLLFNGTGEKRRTGSAWRRGGGESGGGGQEGEMTQTIYAHVNK